MHRNPESPPKTTENDFTTVCCICHKVLTTRGMWEFPEIPVHLDSSGTLSHTFCPDCVKKHYPFAVSKN